MKKFKVLITDDNKEFSKSLESKINTSNIFEVCYCAENGREALEYLRDNEVDIILLDIIMPELDGYEVMLELIRRGGDHNIICLTQLSDDKHIEKAITLGAKYIMVKPINYDSLLARMSDLMAIESLPKAYVNNKLNMVCNSKGRNGGSRAIDERLSNIFISVGIPAHIKGYQFLREAIKLTIVNPDIINSITKRLYPSIADAYDTSASKVERAIRHAIEVAWNRGRIENINNVFGIKVYGANDRPTNGEFIALVADKMMTEGIFA